MMTKRTTAKKTPSGGRPKFWVSSDEKADKAERVPAFPWPRSKVSDQAAMEFQAPLRQALDSLDTAAFQQAISDQQNHPDTVAARLIEAALQSVHLDARVHRDAPWLGEFVMMMRELLADHVPGMTLVQMLAPLQSALSQHGGGRPPKVDAESVVRVRHRLEAAWNTAPTQETAKQFGISDRSVRKIIANDRKQKPG